MTEGPDARRPPVPAPGERGVIHDIGYRRYDGPRLGPAAIRRALFVDGARGAYGLGRAARSKVVPMALLAVICLPAVVLGIVTGVTGADELPAGYAAYAVNLQVLVSVFVAAQAPVMVSRDLRHRVVPLYFARPMRRVEYVQARYAAMAAAVFALLAAPLTILLAGALLAELPVGEQVADYLRALAGAALLALVVAGIGLVIAALTPRRGLGVAAIVTVLLVLAGVQAAVQNIAAQEGAATAAGYSAVLSPFTLVDVVGSRLLGADGALPSQDVGTTGGLLLLLVALLLVAGSFAALVLRYRKVSLS